MEEYSLDGKPIRKINGYEIIHDPNHPLANKSGIVYVHRHIASIKLGRWLVGKELVHHLDGNRGNNNPDNLEVTTREKHVFMHDSVIYCNKITETKICSYCGKEYKQKERRRRIFFCSVECQRKNDRKFEITKEELEKLVWEKPTTQLAKEFNCSDKAIEKRCKRLGINKPPRGYWRKLEASTN